MAAVTAVTAEAPKGLWVNVWQGKLTGVWIALVRDGDTPAATFLGESEAEARVKAEAEIARRRHGRPA